jgi:hypothetical protein
MSPFTAFGRLRPPAAPPELRGAALAAAAATWSETPARTALVDRLWESRPLRRGWSLVVLALLALNALLAEERGVPPGLEAVVLASSGAAAAAETGGDS